MGGKQREPELLGALSDLSGCLYLSDLRSVEFRTRLHWALSQTPAECRPEEEWREAVCYLLNRKPKAGSAEELRQILLDFTI